MNASSSPAPSELRIRPARGADASLLADFNRALARETESRELDPERLQRGVAAVLADPARGRYLVAEGGGLPIGGLLLTTEWSDWRDGFFWWIQSVYVLPEHRRCGVYRALHARVLAEARADGGVCGVRLYVERENEGAMRTYRSLGMSPTAYRLFETDFGPGVSPGRTGS